MKGYKKMKKEKEIKIDIELDTKKYIVAGSIIAGLIVSGVVTASLYFNVYKWNYRTPIILQSPVVITKRVEPVVEVDQVQAEEVTPEATESAQVEPVKGKQAWTGVASYYSRKGCLGCSPTLTMANGQALDDNALTLAFNKLPLNSEVIIRNEANGQEVTATVTDRGGFERPGLDRVADLTLATKNAIGCGDLCNVTVIEK